MSKFVFQLENALKYRISIEEQETERLGRVKQKVKAEEDLIVKLNIQKKDHIGSYNRYEANLTTMQQQEAHLSLIDLRIKKQEEKLELAQKAFEIQRSRVVEASTKRKSLEKLKEKCSSEHQLVLSKAEQNMLDDIGIAAYCHKAIN